LNRIRLLGVAIAAVLVMATGAANASAAGLTGAGSSLVAPLMANWINGFEIKEGIPVKYGSVGSGAGIASLCLAARVPDVHIIGIEIDPELVHRDDAGMVEALGLPVVVVPGHEEAFKVTRPLDLLLAEAVLARRESGRG